MSPDKEATITACPDGPYLIRGSYEVIDTDGQTVELVRRTIALCRCGKSAQKPMCDGTHKLSNFRDSRRSAPSA